MQFSSILNENYFEIQKVFQQIFKVLFSSVYTRNKEEDNKVQEKL